jgi:hypothetical protein
MTVNEKQIEAVLKLSPTKRYSHFIKKVVGWRRMWGLYSDGWATCTSPDGRTVLPLWPEREYAEKCIENEWLGYVTKSIEIEEALNVMIPMFRKRGILPGVFFSPKDGSVNCSVDQLESDLRTELLKYT